MLGLRSVTFSYNELVVGSYFVTTKDNILVTTDLLN